MGEGDSHLKRGENLKYLMIIDKFFSSLNQKSIRPTSGIVDLNLFKLRSSVVSLGYTSG